MFITLEGMEGSGKSTQIGMLIPVLEENEYKCLATREPGATTIGKKIREILLDSNNNTIVPLTELLLYEADRAQHVYEVIAPALKAGRIVISDRFFDATIVYQGYARGFDLEFIEAIHNKVLADLRPYLTIILDLAVEEGLKRAWKRITGKTEGLQEDRFEKESLAFHEKVREGYLTLAKREPERFRIVDASKDPGSVHREILDIILARLLLKLTI